MSDNTYDRVIETKNLTMYYGKHRGIIDVNLTVNRGEVYGFLGPNGAGKTTTQRILLDVIRPTTGEAKVFGLDCRKEGVKIRERVGYLPGELSLYKNMTGTRYLSAMASLHGGNIDEKYRKELCERIELDPSRKISEYSRGNKQKIGVVAAFMTKPDLLILDEPTTGLDPLKQQTVLELVDEAKKDGRTVFFSSHILQEVEDVCDRVGIIRDGRVVATERVETLTEQKFKRLRLTLRDTPKSGDFAIEGVTETGREGTIISFEITRNLEAVISQALTYGIEDIETIPVTLEEVFLAYYGGPNGEVTDA
jgi:ABC-2 type transport system ATP-binding protein